MSGTARATTLFRIALGLVFVAAFGSMFVQIAGLLGPQGISPAHELLDEARDSLGFAAYFRAPTVFWILGASDFALRGVCVAGVLAGGLLGAGVAPKPLVALCWLLYLSIVTVGDVFLGYQWDGLLLETAFFAFFLFPSEIFSKTPSPPPRAGVIALQILLFKLMFLSGVVKLASGDENWRGLTAMKFHYWTQPLPIRTAWYAHHAPAFLHELSAAVMLAIEIGVPVLAFAPVVRVRRAAFVLLAGLQAAIALTGNYGFFNLLAIALCLPLLDDALLARVIPAEPKPAPFAKFDRALAIGALVLFVPLSVAEGFAPRALAIFPRSLVRELRALSTFNSYGLFAVMTTSRREIEIQGSADGHQWVSYEFGYKPGDVGAAPRFAGPHLPRLDWQMWFAGLGSCRDNPWILRFQQRLLTGTPQVTALLRKNPFEKQPPRYLRSPTFEYRFSDAGPAWWIREPDEDYCPALSLDENGRLQAAELPE